jgi:polyhydroxyalkanoate synthase
MFATLNPPRLNSDAPVLKAMTPLQRKLATYERTYRTPMHVVYQENKLTVWKLDTPETSDKVPLLLIPALINRNYILDLSETNSVAKALAEKGYAVYLVDWGTATEEDRWMTLPELFHGPVRRIIRKVTRHAGRKPALFGYCLGGIISNIYTSMYPDDVAGLISMVAPVDFSKAGIMAQWTAAKHLDSHQVVDALGNVPPEMVQNGFTVLKPAAFYRKWISAFEKQDDEAFLDNFLNLETWVNDNIPFPGGIWQEYIAWLYQDNRLFKDELWMGPRKASLSNITCPTLAILASNDHIVPPDAAQPLVDMVGSDDASAITLKGGHVGIIASNKLFPQLINSITEWLDARATRF